ncbi:MAG: hypothetical protein HYX75_23675 [Acidobacteria bacterium]|nr:hypothetical protein [Acidobacteriota bacterium]
MLRKAKRAQAPMAADGTTGCDERDGPVILGGETDGRAIGRAAATMTRRGVRRSTSVVLTTIVDIRDLLDRADQARYV